MIQQIDTYPKKFCWTYETESRSHACISELNIKPKEAIFVGDNVEADYKRAEKAGIHALLLDRTQKKQSGLRTIKNLEEILSQIT
jgi:FMN phosphatase YigB (HAD superfamily)